MLWRISTSDRLFRLACGKATIQLFWRLPPCHRPIHQTKGHCREARCPGKMGYSVAAQRGIGHTCSQELWGAGPCVPMPHSLSTWRSPAMPAVAAPPMMRLTPRPYQNEAVAALLAAAARGVQRPLLVLPTGTGKTSIVALLVQRRGGRALILAHRDELIQQAVDKLHLVDRR